jgi:hypothetical protein
MDGHGPGDLADELFVPDEAHADDGAVLPQDHEAPPALGWWA